MNYYEIKTALAEATKEGGVNLFSEASPGNWERIAHSGAHKLLVDELRDTGARYKAEPMTNVLFSDYKQFETTGDRSYESGKYFPRRGRLAYLCALTLLDGGEENIAALEDIIWAICDEYTWCVAAHMGGSGLEIVDRKNIKAYLDSGYTGRKLREHRQRVDLFASETGFALAETLHLLKDKIHPLVADRAEKEILNRIIEPYMALNEPFDWETGTANWTSVCSGAIGSASIYMIKDDAVLALIIRNVIDSMDRYFLGFSSEGVCMEGTGYWMYGFSFFASFSELLCQRTGGRIDLLKDKRWENVATFIQRARITENIFPTFSDCGVGMRFHLGLFERLREKFPVVNMPPVKHAFRLKDDGCYRFCNFLRAFVWYTGQIPEDGEPEGDTVFEGAQWAISRLKGGTAMAAKGGCNAEPHNQNDVGNFMLLSNGEMLFPDLGSGRYSRQYFGPERYGFFNCGSQGHSVPIIDGKAQCFGENYAAREFKAYSEKGVMRVEMEIAGAYAVSGLKKIFRVLTFSKNERRFILEDSFGMDKQISVTERVVAVSARPPELSAGEVAIFGINTKAKIYYDADTYECAVSKAPEDASFGLTGYKIYTVDWHVKKTDKPFVFNIRIQL